MFCFSQIQNLQQLFYQLIIYFLIKIIKINDKMNSQSSQPYPSHPSSQYSSKSSKRAYFGNLACINISPDQSSQFSFSKGILDTGKVSIREDLSKLCKEDLIQIILEEIQQSKILRVKLATLQQQCKIMGSFREDSFDGSASQQYVSIQKYQQLSDYMQQYISNTNQAQTFFTSMIKDLKQENNSLRQENGSFKQENNRLKQQNHELLLSLKHQAKRQRQKQQKESGQKIQQLEQMIRNLEDSVDHYVKINNQHTRKYDKLKKMYDMLEQQLAIALESYRYDEKSIQINNTLLQSHKPNIQHPRPDNQKTEQSTPQQRQLKQQIKLLQIQNNELKQSCLGLQRTLQTKSDKIRKLLEQMQKLSEQKWLYKQRYMQIKSKSYMLTNSSSKNSVFDTSVHQEIHVDQYSSIKG